MGIRKLKYISIFLLPITVSVAFTVDGWLTFLPLVVFFIGVPLLEHFMPPAVENLTEEERHAAGQDPFYNFLIYAILELRV